jgi:hypothetical protein
MNFKLQKDLKYLHNSITCFHVKTAAEISVIFLLLQKISHSDIKGIPMLVILNIK